MLENIFKIDKSMGESRAAQVLGIVIIVALLAIVATFYYYKYF